MKITATTKMDYKTVRAFAYMNMFRTNKPLKKVLLYCIISILLAAVIWLEMFLMDPSSWMIVLLVVDLVVLLIELYLYLVYPRMVYKGMGELKGCVNTFTFLDDKIQIQSKDNGYTGDATMEYKYLRRIMETPDYMYLFQTNRQVLTVDKNTLKGGTAEQLRGVLVGFVNGRYKIYKK